VRVLGPAALAAATLAALACGSAETEYDVSQAGGAEPPAILDAASRASGGAGAYSVSPNGGTPRTGPGDRYNNCERIWCLTHEENFPVDHFLERHAGWIIHDTLQGDIFAPKGRSSGPAFPHAKLTALRLCGSHVHPHLLGKHGGPVRDGYYTYGLGYNRAHYRAFGTRLDPCCINGLGSDYLHASDGRRLRFHDLREYREHPEMGWQRPYIPTAGSGG
jgi:hypothetical protein